MLVKIRSLALMASFCVVSVVSAQAPVDVLIEKGIYQPVSLDDYMMTAGAPNPNEWKQLHQHGVRAVIDLRAASEIKNYDEREDVTANGMRYHSLPTDAATDITRVQAGKLMALVAQEKQQLKPGEKILVHCASGNRVGALIALGLMQQDGVSEEQAIAVGRSAGLKSLEQKVRDAAPKPRPQK